MTDKGLVDVQTWLAEVAQELNDLFDIDPMEMYRHLTGLGDTLLRAQQPAPTAENFVHGCTSNVYIEARLDQGRVWYLGSSEALVVRGYVAILVEALSGLAPQDIGPGTRKLIEAFAEKTNIRATLTPSRANAFGNIYKLMEDKALALSGAGS